MQPPPNETLRGGLRPAEFARMNRRWWCLFFILMLGSILASIALGAFRS